MITNTETNMNTQTEYQIPFNRFGFVRSIKDKNDAFWAQKILGQLDLTPDQLYDLKTLHRYSTTLHRLDENSCNGWPRMFTEIRDGKMYRFDKQDDQWRAKDEKTEANINKKIEAIAAKNNWKIELQGDPRGWPMRLKIGETDCSVLVNYK